MRIEEESYYCDGCRKTIIEHTKVIPRLGADIHTIYKIKLNKSYNHYCSEECLFNAIKEKFDINIDRIVVEKANLLA